MSGCPPAEQLARLAEGGLSEEESAALHAHIRGCSDCRQVFAGLADGSIGSTRSPTEGKPAAPLQPGEQVGRFTVERQLGQGRMGSVHAARDPELNRTVALKSLLVADADGSGLRRLRREAQAMARLSHPNVTTVYEVVAHAGGIYLAMELVEGGTVSQWLAAKPRSWREILDVFISAGRGLSAAHAAGLVHRDFKPDNVLIGQDGRVRVTDFGLSRMMDAPEQAKQPSDPKALTSSLSASGMLVGTPAYMAPEQLAGQPADVRADVFSFSVALFQALYGERPFEGRTLEDLRQAILTDQVRPAPKGSKVPAFVRRALLHGLRGDREQRAVSIDTLLRELSADPAVRRRRMVYAGLGAAALAVAGFGYKRAVDAQSQLCSGSEQRLAGVWDEPRRAQVHAAFAATKAPFAEDAWTAFDRALGAFRSGFIAQRTEACQATRRGEQSEQLLDLRMHCLDRRLQEARGLVDVFAAADVAVVRRAQRATEAMTPLAVCADVQQLRAAQPLPADPAVRATIAALQSTLANARALNTTARYKQALAAIEPALPAAEATGYRPLVAELLVADGLNQRVMGDKRTDATLRKAALVSEAAGRDDLAAQAWTELLAWQGSEEGKPDEALPWADHARACIERMGGDEEAESLLEEKLGDVIGDHGHADEALPHLRRALELKEKKYGPDNPLISFTVEALALGLVRAHQNEAAIAVFQREVPLTEKRFGPNHPSMATMLLNYSAPLMEVNRLAEAHAALERALAIFQAAETQDSPITTPALNNLGDVERMMSQPDQAEGHYRRVLAILEPLKMRPNSRAYAYSGIGGCMLDRKRPKEAVAPLERAIALRKESQAAPEDLAMDQFSLAKALWDSGGDKRRARQLANEALALLTPLKLDDQIAKVKPWVEAHR